MQKPADRPMGGGRERCHPLTGPNDNADERHHSRDCTGGKSLRPYQADVVAELSAAITDPIRALLVAPTGSGKTIIASSTIDSAVAAGRRVLFLAHRREIITQSSAKLHAAGVPHGIIQAGFPMRLAEPVQVASIQTLHARAVRGDRIELPPADLVVVDEAHRARARTYRQLLGAYPGAAVIGLTATPCRGDGRGLGDVFQQMIECPPVAKLIAEGYLVGTRIYAPTRPDLKGVRVERGDYVESQLAGRMDRAQLVGDIVVHWLRHAERRRTVVFASSVGHSVHIRDCFLEAGVRAEHLDGRTPAPERDAILARLASGELGVVCNYGILTEGWDQPEVSCLVLARPTKHMGLYRQMVGRGLRPAPGKTDCLVLDHAGAVYEHGFAEDPVRWTLRTDCRADNPRHRKRQKREDRALSACPQCSAVRIGYGPCKGCGWRPQPKPETPDIAAGELARVDRARRRAEPVVHTLDGKREFQAQLAWIANERGYRPGWIAHKYRERYGVWPVNNDIEPVEPKEETRAWVRSRALAYARSLQGVEP